MPFKKGKSPADVAKRINKALTEDLPKDIERGLFDMYAKLSGHADYYTPLDTGALRNSKSYRIRQNGDKWVMTYGYYTEYAAALHVRTDWPPKPPGSHGKPNGGYNPDAESNWMNIAWNEVGDDAVKNFARMIEPK